MPVLTSWSARTLAVSLALWAILVTAYVSLGLTHQGLLPSPYNTLLMVVLTMLTLSSVVGILAERTESRIEARANVRHAEVREWLVALETRVEVSADVRYARLHAMTVRLDRRLDAMDAPTEDLARPQLAIVGRAAPVDEAGLPGYARGYVDGLARQPMAERANVIPLERSN